MEPSKLKEILANHSEWCKDSSKGERASLYGADLTGADLYGANLYGADLTRANLYGADLSGANLCGANLRGANLYGADLTRANLYGADLTRANLYGANLTGTLLEGKVIVSFQFQQHLASYWGQDEIVIGCKRLTIADWATKFQEIGQQQGYTPEQISKYGRFIRSCARDYKLSNKLTSTQKQSKV